MMTTEELALAIKEEQRTELVLDLWEKVERYLYKMCSDAYRRRERAFAQCGVEVEDLKQESYFVFLQALHGYKPEAPEPFLAYLKYPFRNMVNKLRGRRNGAENKRPLDNALSLNAPVLRDGDEEGGELLEFVPDAELVPHAEQSVRRERNRAVNAAVLRLDDPYKEIIERNYFKGESASEIAGALGLDLSDCVNARKRALVTLRKDNGLRYLWVNRVFHGLEGKFKTDPSLFLPSWDGFTRSEPYKEAKRKADAAPSYGTGQAIIFEAYQKYRSALVDKST